MRKKKIPTTARWSIHGVSGRNKAINYIKDAKKTDGGILVTGINCSSEFADFEMRMNNQKFHIHEDDSARTCYHGYQSFDPKEKDLTPQQVHQIGVELVTRLYSEYQVLVATHIDRGHLHNHFIINSVNMGGKKLEDRLANPIEGLYGLRDVSDQIAIENNLHIIHDAPKIGKYHKNKYLYSLANQTWKSQIIKKIESLKEQCYSFDEMMENLLLDGYQIKYGKNIRIKPLGKQKFVTMKVLGEEYSQSSLEKFFFDKRKNNISFYFEDYEYSNRDSVIVKLHEQLAQRSKNAILYSMKWLKPNDEYPHYYNSRYLEMKRYQKLVNTIKFLNDNEIYNYDVVDNRIKELQEMINKYQSKYDKQLSSNETLQIRVPLCHLYLKYLDYYESYREQKDISGISLEPSDEVKTFMDIKKELQVQTTSDVKEILSYANRIKAETNRQYAYLHYLKNELSDLERIKSISLESSDEYIKSISFSKKMIDFTRTNESDYCIRVPYSKNIYIYIPKSHIAWINYDERGMIYLVNDKEYFLYNKSNQVVSKICGEELAELSRSEKQKVNKLYKDSREK